MKNLPAELKADLESRYNLGLYHLQELAQKVSAERDRQDAQRLFDSMKKDFPDLSERMLKAMLSDKYYTDERTASAWQSRYASPATWGLEVERIRGELAIETHGRIDHDMTATVAAVTAAVMRGGGITPREPAMPDLNKLSDREFAAFKKDNFGFDSRG